MPFYEYQCKNCGHELEAMQKVTDSPLKKCPHCGKSQLRRLMSAPVFRLKGQGWYETDFKGEGDTKRNLADKPEADAPKVADSTTPKTDAKPDAKAEPSVADAAKEKSVEKPTEKATAKTESKKVDLKRGKQAAKKPAVRSKKKSR